jgi:hypothetical protein
METKLSTPIHINTIQTQEKLPDDLYDCAICYDKIQKENNSKTKCGHYFCGTCLEAWLGINTTCPMCRTVIRERQPQPTPQSRQTPVRISAPTPRTDNIPTHRRGIVSRNIIERYTWEQYFMASNNLKNNAFFPEFDDINKSSYASADFGDNLLY